MPWRGGLASSGWRTKTGWTRRHTTHARAHARRAGRRPTITENGATAHEARMALADWLLALLSVAASCIGRHCLHSLILISVHCLMCKKKSAARALGISMTPEPPPEPPPISLIMIFLAIAIAYTGDSVMLPDFGAFPPFSGPHIETKTL